MSVDTESSCIHQIGEVAGQVWHELAQVEKTSVSKLVKSMDAPRDIVMQAIGWLAREGKIEIQETSRGRSIALTEEEAQYSLASHQNEAA